MQYLCLNTESKGMTENELSEKTAVKIIPFNLHSLRDIHKLTCTYFTQLFYFASRRCCKPP